jgi:mannose-6-phosphate isomerase-like protein (cupin superfamily)
MGYQIKQSAHKEKLGIRLDVYPDISDNCGVAIISAEVGHNQEFYHKQSAFNYIILEGQGSFFLDDEEVKISAGDMLSIDPGTRIYYKGKLKMLLITTPAWREDAEVETKSQVWK